MSKTHGIEVDLQITNRCPLTCEHCVYDSSMRHDYGLPKTLIERLCCEFEEIGVSQVSITGGEPFIRKDLLEVISTISSCAIEVCVQTSGLLVDKMDFEGLWRSGLDLLLVSIDGLPNYHDQFRHRKGIFDDAKKTVTMAIAHNIPVRINTVVTKSNVEQVIELLPIAQDLGVDTFSFFYFSPVGRGSNHPTQVLSFSEWNDFAEEVRAWCEKKNQPSRMKVKIQSVAVPVSTLPPSGQECRIKDRDNILILANGEVYPCVFLCHQKELCLGNIFEESLVRVWKNSKRWTDAYNPFFQISGKDCAEVLVSNCSGGCPAFRRLMPSECGFCDKRCEWDTSGLVPGCAREYEKLT